MNYVQKYTIEHKSDLTWTAYLFGDTSRYAIGETKEEAIKKLHLTYPEFLGEYEYIIPPEQFYMAYKLANRFFHAWATCMPESEAFTHPWTVNEIVRYTDEHFDSEWAYNDGPGINEEGVSEWETQGQRYSWKIWPNGYTVIRIQRPAGTVFTITINIDNGERVTIERNKEIQAYWYHVECVEHVLLAFFSPNQINHHLVNLVEDNQDILLAVQDTAWDRALNTSVTVNRLSIPEPYQKRGRRWLLMEHGKWTAGRIYIHEGKWDMSPEEIINKVNTQPWSHDPTWRHDIEETEQSSRPRHFSFALPLEGEGLPEWMITLLSQEVVPEIPKKHKQENNEYLILPEHLWDVYVDELNGLFHHPSGEPVSSEEWGEITRAWQEWQIRSGAKKLLAEPCDFCDEIVCICQKEGGNQITSTFSAPTTGRTSRGPRPERPPRGPRPQSERDNK